MPPEMVGRRVSRKTYIGALEGKNSRVITGKIVTGGVRRRWGRK
jgi:hypothetical protein